MRKYTEKLLDLVNRYDPAAAPKTIKDWFVNCLPPKMYRYVVRCGVTTLEEAQKEAQIFADSEETHIEAQIRLKA